jgi:hypothetical protein
MAALFEVVSRRFDILEKLRAEIWFLEYVTCCKSASCFQSKMIFLANRDELAAAYSDRLLFAKVSACGNRQ